MLEAASRGNFLVLNEAVPALEELGKSLGASFLRWDAHNFGFDTQEHYSPSERAYYLEHGARIVRAMEENPVLRAKTAARTRYSTAGWQNISCCRCWTPSDLPQKQKSPRFCTGQKRGLFYI